MYKWVINKEGKFFSSRFVTYLLIVLMNLILDLLPLANGSYDNKRKQRKKRLS